MMCVLGDPWLSVADAGSRRAGRAPPQRHPARAGSERLTIRPAFSGGNSMWDANDKLSFASHIATPPAAARIPSRQNGNLNPKDVFMSEISLHGAALSPPDASGNSQWIQLLGAGPQMGRDGRGPFEAPEPQAVIDRSFRLVSGGVLPIDFNHATDLAAPKGGDAPAAGWISRMEARPDGIWGLAEWTPRGGQAVKERENRFISPVISHSSGQVQAILRASLTNTPNLPLVALNAACTRKDTMEPDTIAELRKLLDLPAEANDADLLAKARIVLASANAPDPAKYVPISIFQETVRELNSVRVGVSRREAEAEVNRALMDRKLMPFIKDWAIELCATNKPAFDAFVDGAGQKVNTFLNTLIEPAITSEQVSRLERGSRSQASMTSITANLGLSEENVSKFGGAR